MLPTRVVAALIALLGVLPLWRILPQRATGLAGSATAQAAAVYASTIWTGVLVALIPAILAALLVDSAKLEQMLRRAAGPLAQPRSLVYAATVAWVALLAASFVALVIMDGRATLIDSFAQLTQARYMAAGRLAGPVLDSPEFWLIPQTLVTANGWVSQYPPGYSALLALGFILGNVALVGPVMLAVAVFFTSLIADEVFASRLLARTAALLAAISPFMLAQAGSYMSHVPAAAFAAALLYFVLRGMRGGVGYAIAAGICSGALFTIRPLTGVIAGVVAAVYVMRDRRPFAKRATRVAIAVAAAAPFIIAVAAYNAHFFGSPATFGYDAALGPNAGLGFGQDPWGNAYGPLEAFAYTSAELTALSVHLLETPLPLALFVGLYFMTARTVAAPVRLLFWWVMALVVAYLFYWHHGLFLGPRMLADMGTLWVLLVVIAAAGLSARIPAEPVFGRYSLRSFAVAGVTTALLAGVLILSPARLLSYTPPADVQELLRPPAVQRPALVFVHGGWTARIGASLAARGMRADSVETALRQNGTCKVHDYAHAGAAPRALLDFTPRATALPPAVQVSPGNRIRMERGERIDAGCAAEIASDTAGVVDISPYIWQADLPGLEGSGALFVRDMGPATNARLIARYPERTPLMLTEASGDVTLVPYEAGARARWSVAP